jgi:hypothetical protein
MQAIGAAKPRAFATGKVRPAKAVIMDAVPVEVSALPRWNERLRWLARARG